jgi:hypothetical protein
MRPDELDGYSDLLKPGSDTARQLTAQPNHALTMRLAFRDAPRGGPIRGRPRPGQCVIRLIVPALAASMAVRMTFRH